MHRLGTRLIAERLSARQLILHHISAGVCIYIYIYIYICVSRLGMQFYCVLRTPWPALLLLTSHMLTTSTYVRVRVRTYIRIYVG